MCNSTPDKHKGMDYLAYNSTIVGLLVFIFYKLALLDQWVLLFDSKEIRMST